MSDMHRLPDGSGFFTATIYSERSAGFVNWLKYTKKAHARRHLFVWRMYCCARQDWGPKHPKMPPIKALIAAWRCP
ncbi:MAG: hypothetical protein K0R61_15 [Microvirga sp.]|jgi:hypothetical protein|nr:hypothetical protein [Microvirga sp.]MDF2969565.1 hypothetical protein [Microvirga sp.]